MAGLTKDSPLPTEILLHQQSRRLEMAFSDGKRFTYSFEFLRIASPSAEVRGHGPGQETLQTGKRDVEVTTLEPVGNYALQPTFSDGHATGIYSWDYLYEIGENQDALWADYLKRMNDAGASRDAAAQATPAKPALAAHQAIAPAAPLGTKHRL
jgi:DUF971 family protein